MFLTVGKSQTHREGFISSVDSMVPDLKHHIQSNPLEPLNPLIWISVAPVAAKAYMHTRNAILKNVQIHVSTKIDPI